MQNPCGLKGLRGKKCVLLSMNESWITTCSQDFLWIFQGMATCHMISSQFTAVSFNQDHSYHGPREHGTFWAKTVEEGKAAGVLKIPLWPTVGHFSGTQAEADDPLTLCLLAKRHIRGKARFQITGLRQSSGEWEWFHTDIATVFPDHLS